jgi:hypothetical protein
MTATVPLGMALAEKNLADREAKAITGPQKRWGYEPE